MKNYLVFHGHFYQPPREDPWTGIIGTQPSAAPYHDWNGRITRECYAANAASRFLRYDGRIEDIINNYRFLSFNFGPTLMWWLKEHAVHVYEAIIEADVQSREMNNGHGNAIAQAYNHTILPLDEVRDARLQIKWGLADFEYHFDRKAEGMWLPEAAVNDTVLDILIEEGMRFVILSPWQAEAILGKGSEEWEELGSSPAPFWRPYRIERPGGDISVFFYNQDLAQGISFEHYLHSADALYSRLLTYHNDADPGHIIHTATDGEIYGHHEAFGDMCLSALHKNVQESGKFIFTNYANYLDMYPPTYQVKLRPGESDLGSSWSCHHGVSRWYKDCGCSTGGKPEWNQKWRSPLRKAFRMLSEHMWEIFKEESGKRSDTPPEKLLEEYISVLTTQKEARDFALEHLKRNHTSEHEVSHLLNLLEGQKYRMYTFTSCGWFFADIGGIEPVQNIRYALKAQSLYQEYSKRDLYAILAEELQHGLSNVKNVGTGSDILAREKSAALQEGVEAAAYYFIRLLVYKQKEKKHNYGFYSLDKIEELSQSKGSLRARVYLTEITRLKNFKFELKAEITEEGEFSLRVRDLLDEKGQETIEDLTKLPFELRQKLSRYLVQSSEESMAEQSKQAFEQIKFAVIQSGLLGIQAPPIIRKSAELSVSSIVSHLFRDSSSLLSEKQVSHLEEILDFAAEYEIKIDKIQVTPRISQFLWEFFNRYDKDPCRKKCKLVARILKGLHKAKIEADLTIPQKTVFAQLRKWREKIALLQAVKGGTTKKQGTSLIIATDTLRELSAEQKEDLGNLLKLCAVMGIYADDIALPFGKL